MRIQTRPSSSFWHNILILTGLLVVSAFLNDRFSNCFPLKETEPSPLEEAGIVAFMEKEASLSEVLEFFKDRTIFLSVKDDASLHFSKELRAQLAAKGGKKLAELGFRHSYAGIIRQGKFAEENLKKKQPASAQDGNTTVTSAGMDAGNFSRLKLGRNEYEAPGRGLNLFVLDENGRKLAGTWNFDFFGTENPLSKGIPGRNFIPGLETIELVLKEKNYRKLDQKRQEALEKQILVADDDDFVPAHLFFRGEQQKAEVRLKGDWTDHLQGDQWSFRVKLDGEAMLMGMRKFSLHRPGTRNYAGEWLFHEVLRSEGLLNLQYYFVQVALTVTDDEGNTTKNLGIYALEEFFDKQLIERNQRREGVLLKLDENPFWQERAEFLTGGTLDYGDLQYIDFEPYETARVVPFGEKKVRQDSVLFKQFLTAASFFEAYLRGEKPLSEVWDVEKTAKFNAVCLLLGAGHALAAHNYRAYYNPVTSKLEPVGFDGNAGQKILDPFFFYQGDKDPVYLEAFVKALEEVSGEDFYQKVLNWPGLQANVELMKKIQPDYEWSEKTLKHNQQMIRSFIRPSQNLRVMFDKMDGEYLHLTIQNFGRFPVRILKLENTGGRTAGTPNEPVVLSLDASEKVIFKLDRNFGNLFTNKKKKKAGFDFQQDIEKLRVVYETPGLSESRREKILPWNTANYNYAATDPFQAAPNARDFDFLLFDETRKTITCQPGLWQLEKMLVVPSGYTFRAGPGVRIELMNQNAKIISFSPLSFAGSASSPVEVFSDTRLGKGILVLNCKDTSRLAYCRFAGLSNPSTYGWSVSGAVNFYEAPVNIAHCVFTGNRCEDGLNVIRCHVEMDDVVFSHTQSDAFDGDFVKGVIKNCQFNDLGNDAIDVSGSELSVENVVIEKAGDKGLSAGENSHLKATRILIKNSEIALAAKDNSTLEISDSKLINNALAFTAFQKKPEFGPAEMLASSVDLNGNKVDFLIENRSSLKLNGRQVETVSLVKEKMYGVEFGKSSL